MLDDVPLKDLPRVLDYKKEWDLPSDNLLMSYLYKHGNLDLALAFRELFFPKILCVKGYYLREQCYSKKAAENWDIHEAATLQDKQKVENVLNHLHLYDLFHDDHPDTRLEVEEALAKTMLASWQYALDKQFPEQEFTFYYGTEPDDYGPTVSFW